MKVIRTLLMAAFWVIPGAAGFSVAETPPGDEPLAVVRPLPKKITFIYVHGFAEHKEELPFQSNLEDFFSEWEIEADVATYRWDKLELKPSMVVAQWNQSKKTVMSRIPDFIDTVLKKFETEQKPYVLIGYSLGSRLVAESLKKNEMPLQYLKGVHFLGSALPNNYSFEDCRLPEAMKIANYYSPNFDSVLKITFYHAEGMRAGGETGFENPLVENYRTACHHAHIGGPICRDYSSLGPCIAWLTFYREGIFLNSGEKEIALANLAIPTGAGKLHWNEVIRFDDITIEQNANANLFRAVKVSPEKKRIAIGVSRNLHHLLSEIGEYPPEMIRLNVNRIPKTRGRKKNRSQ